MSCINVQLSEAIVNAKIAKVNEIRLSLRKSGLSFASGSIRWKAKTATTFTLRIVNATEESTRTVTLSANGWSNETFADQDCEIFISPKANISEFQLTEDVSEYVVIDWGSFIYSSITKLITYKSLIDARVLPRLSSITEWNSTGNILELDFDTFTSQPLLTKLILTYSNVTGNTEKISILSNLKELGLGCITDLKCKLSDFAQCADLEILSCSDSLNVTGTIADLIPLSGSLTTLRLNGSRNVSGEIKVLRSLPLLTDCSLGYTGVTGSLTDLNGMKQNGTLVLRASGYITNTVNSVVLENNATYTITFDNNRLVSNVTRNS